jgi:cytoskeletal protein CcmA (bactofilin family)
LARGSGDRLDDRQTAPGTVIAREARVEGEISGRSPVRIEGRLKGSVRLEAPLEVLGGAEVEADLHATAVRVAGTVTGNVTATELIELLATAVVKGDVTAPALHVVEGARLEGRVQMRAEKVVGPSAG